MKDWLSVTAAACVPLAFGYLWLAGSIWLHFEVPAAGAVLISFCLIAELWHTNSKWRRSEGESVSYRQNKKRNERTYEYPIGAFDSANNDNHIDALFRLAKPNELSHPVVIDGDVIGGEWAVSKTASRVDLRVTLAITVSAIIGSIVWGYGHLVFPPEDDCKACIEKTATEASQEPLANEGAQKSKTAPLPRLTPL